ncbi:MAG TPA: winged helix-turn-helix domain-containing protein [Stellaceae bacterium]|nr:winged helix-turn-helix domain-containing protein [Stellaceae bacterium]
MAGIDDDFRFGPFRLSRRRRELTSEEGPVALGGRAFDLLLALTERPGAVLSKHELLDIVWPGVVVEENNLAVQVATLRRALGPHQALIQTVPGRGYRFGGEIETLSADVPKEPQASVRAPPPEASLPLGATPLVGRDAELEDLQRLLGETRLLTIAGPSGIGKTRIAVALGHARGTFYPGGVRFIDFAPRTDVSMVEGAVIAALGLRLKDQTLPADAIAAGLEGPPTLLLFDNCEHVVGGVASLAAALLRRSANLSIVVTSQEPLRIEAETVYRLDPLALPPRGVDDIRPFGAVALFLRRVEAIDRRFRLGPDNTAAVAEICRSLDGIPLALEMAAARVPMLGIEGVRDRLGERFRVLTTGARTAEIRHRTLRDTVAWSHDLLDPGDRAVFRRLGIFTGGFSAEAAASIVAERPAEEWEVVDALGRLIDKSMVVAEPGDRPRYRLLETLRLYALEQLAAHGEHPALAARHAAYFDRLFDAAYETWEGVDDAVWLQRHAVELDNVAAALDWALAKPGAETLAVSLSGSAALLWDKLSLAAQGRRYLERAEAAIGGDTPPALAARLLRQAGNLWQWSDRRKALALLDRAAAIYRETGDTAGLGGVLSLVGAIRMILGESAEAARILGEARTLLEPSGRRKSLFNALNCLGVLAGLTGNMAAARDMFEEMLQFTRRSGARDREIVALVNLAEAEFNLGQYEEAAERAATVVHHLRTSSRQEDLAWALVNLATYRIVAGRVDEARDVAAEALQVVRPTGGYILRASLQQWALIAANAGYFEDAAHLAGFVEAGLAAAGETRQPTEQRVHDELERAMEAGLPPVRLAHLLEAGRALSEPEAAALAQRVQKLLGETETTASSAGKTTPPPAGPAA